MKRLTKTGIEYGDRGWNFYPGCLHKPQGICPVPHCWAEGMSKRQRQDFHQPHLIPELLLAPLSIKKPSVILVDFMGDLFGDWVDPDMVLHEVDEDGELYDTNLRTRVLQVIRARPEHTFLFLTKAPQNIVKWGPLPDNAWVGATVCNQQMFIETIVHLSHVKARHKWLSLEPLLEDLRPHIGLGMVISFLPRCHYITNAFRVAGIDWLVIGAQSQPDVMPKLEWVREIVEAADRAGIPVWLKNNLRPLLIPEDCRQPNALMEDLFWDGEKAKLRQEFPK